MQSCFLPRQPDKHVTLNSECIHRLYDCAGILVDLNQHCMTWHQAACMWTVCCVSTAELCSKIAQATSNWLRKTGSMPRAAEPASIAWLRWYCNFHSLHSQVVIRRGEAISGPPGPILVATRNDVLDDIVDRTPADRRQGGGPHSTAQRQAGCLMSDEA